MAQKKPRKKCPDCRKTFASTKNGHSLFTKHWYSAHYKPKAKKVSKVYKRPRAGGKKK